MATTNSMRRLLKRLAALVALALVALAPAALIAFQPEVFEIGALFVLRYHLHWLMPLWTHTDCLRYVYVRRSNFRSRVAFAVCCIASAAGFVWLNLDSGFKVFAVVTAVPGLYVLLSDRLSGNRRISGHT
jgi:hypothetical protein